MTDVVIRPLAARDSFDALTALLHRAYAPLAAAGMDFMAASQSADVTRQRVAEGHCLVAEAGGELLGTVTVCGPYEDDLATWAAEAPWFRERDTAHFHQFAVDPRQQRRGVGRLLVAAGERWARDCGFRRMALDTAEPATALRALYRRLGYAEVGHVRWQGRHYRSVVMLKSLDRSPLREHLLTLARYNRWATQALFTHVDALDDADYRRPAGLFFGSVHGTLNHLLVGEHLLWQQRFADGESPAVALDAEAEPDRGRLRERLLEGADTWLTLLELWSEDTLHGRLDYRRIAGQPVSLPFAATLAHVFNHATHHRGQITRGAHRDGQAVPRARHGHHVAR